MEKADYKRRDIAGTRRALKKALSSGKMIALRPHQQQIALDALEGFEDRLWAVYEEGEGKT